ncbi:MAG TPA: hypothetical protein VFB34_01965 [Chloroflexota bacterium]|nr:hypothetical protein [Chloroflexota bacterium]
MSHRDVAFAVGKDYHLGDLLWLTVVVQRYRQICRPRSVWLVLPNRPISRILEHHPFLDGLVYGLSGDGLRRLRAMFGPSLIVHDLRPLPVARSMLADYRRYRPWLYYRDLWLQPRGQWLATYLGLGTLEHFRPSIVLTHEDRGALTMPNSPYVVLAPHTGSFTLPGISRLWRRIKGWDMDNWRSLANGLRRVGVEPVTLGQAGQPVVPGSRAVVGLPIRQAAAVIESASALITGESGLWFVAAATRTPFVIVPWWLPASVDWAGPMEVPYRLVRRDEASPETVYRRLQEILHCAC